MSFRYIRGPYRDRTGDLHNAIVALSQTELTALFCTQDSQQTSESQFETSCVSRRFFLSFTLRMRSPLLLFVSLLLTSVVMLTCKDKLPSQDDANNITLPDSNLSFSKDIERLFSARCLSCHAGASQPDLSPPSYSSLMNYQPQLVVSGQGSNSLLIQLLDGRAQPEMPPSGARLTQNQIDGIRRWIDEGAINN